ncbi:MAG: thioredoxin-dependent thiol peroxidase [Chloroflexi bacterium]|nr:thioredoxin-dependent thiol peroxidase [Chloroflexota bacterium]
MLNVGDQAPDFTLKNDAGEDVSLSSLRGKPVILYWYPRDDTPGCTVEACSFRDAYAEFEQAGAVVLGVSTDNTRSHQKFKNKFSLPFTLLSDTDHQVAEQYGVWGLKKFMGREFEGINRITYLIDENGVVKQVWPKVKPEGHADEILQALRSA